MRYTPFAVLAVFITTLLIPLSVSASAPGIQTMTMDGAAANFSGVNDAFGDDVHALIVNDVNAHDAGGQYSADDPKFDGVWGGPNPKGTNSGASGQISADRVCYLTDPTAVASAYTNREYSSAGSGGNGPSDDEWLVEWNGSAWVGDDGKSHNSHLDSITCTSYATPQQTLSANVTSIDAGGSVTLSWADNVRLDELWGPDESHGAASSGYYDPAGPAATCTTTNFTIPASGNTATICKDWDQRQSGSCEDELAPGGPAQRLAAAYLAPGNAMQQLTSGPLAVATGDRCTTRWVCLDSTTENIPNYGPGTTKVNPTAQTTYTYACTNVNGTTTKTVTVNVNSPKATLTVSPSSVSPSSPTAALTATCAYSTTASIDNGVGSVSANGSPHTVNVSPTADTTYTLTCTNENGVSDTDTASVSYNGQPNLVAGAVTPRTATAGVSQTYTATITNKGNATTGSSFTDLFQTATGYTASTDTATGISTIGTDGVAKLAGSNATEPTSLSYKYTGGASTFWMRVCADKSSATDNGSITESNEGDNCGAWTAITVAPALSVTCSPSDTKISAGDSEIWTASPTGGSGGYTYSWSGTPTISGTQKTLTHTYTAADVGTVKASVNVTSGDGQTTGVTACSSTVTVYALPVATIDASPNNVTPSNPNSTLTAKCVNSVSGTIDQGVGAITADGANHTKSVSPSSTTTYTLTCTNAAGATATDSDTVSYNGQPDLTASVVSPLSAPSGVTQTYTATITNGGNAATGAGFTNLFQTAVDYDSSTQTATGVATAGTDSVSKLAGSNTTEQTSLSYKYTGSASYFYMRVCADKASAGDNGSITESNETNNCGGWKKVTVGAAVTVSACSATPNPATTGAQVTWKATVTNGTAPYTYAWTGAVASTTANPKTTYATTGQKVASLTVTDANGVSSPQTTCSTLTVIAPTLLPNYQASGIPSYTGITYPGSVLTFSAKVQNVAGSAAATSTSNLRVQVDVGAPNTAYDNATVNEDTSTRPVAALAAGATSPAVTSLTFTIPSNATVGTVYKFRTCADLPPTAYGYIGEGINTGEKDNCGMDGSFTVTSPTPPVATLSANPTEISNGSSSTLTASCTNSTSGSIDQGVGAITADGANHTKSVSPSSTTNYTLTCTGPGGTRTDSANVTVDACYGAGCNPTPPSCYTSGTCTCTNPALGCYPTPQPPQVTCSANPPVVNLGQTSSITWNSLGATTCSSNIPGGGTGTSGTKSVSPTDMPTTNYQVTCTNSVGPTVCPVSITVHSPSASISADPVRLTNGAKATLTWSGTDVTACTVSGPGLSVSGNADGSGNFSKGSPATSPAITGQSTYTIDCTTATGPDATDSVTLNTLPGFTEF